MLRIDYHTLAIQELEEAARWIEAARRGWGARLIEAVSEAAERIAVFPESGELIRRSRRYGPIRMVPLRTFPYVIVYGEQPEVGRPIILAVAHGRRSPGSWRERGG